MVCAKSTATSSKIQKSRRRIPRLMKKESFKKHIMYGPDGKAYKANTHKQHLAMKNKGYTHTKPSPKGRDKLVRRPSSYGR